MEQNFIQSKKNTYRLFLLLLIATFSLQTQLFAQKTPDDSGMWLLPQIKGSVHAEMVSKGLRLPSEAFYDSLKPALNDAIVRINIGEGGGGTGSFISSQGLILTNHHVGYDAIASASSVASNYLKEGFFANTLDDEVIAEGYYLYIPTAQINVTDSLKSLQNSLEGFSERDVRDSLIALFSANYPDHVLEIDDYFGGNAQYLAVYKIIRDVRLVFAPPSAIGKFGGDIDNWMWPRHTGDFSFLRAYVTPDGKGTTYDSLNVPYIPAKHLKINTFGVEPSDFVMTLGFPGSTYRFESSYAFNFYQNHRNNYIIQSYQSVLDGLEMSAKINDSIAVANASDRASIANTVKYFEGIQQGFKQYNVVERRKLEEDRFEEWIAIDSGREIDFGLAIPSLKKAYDIANRSGDKIYAGVYTLRNNDIFEAVSILEPFYTFLKTDSLKKFSKNQRNALLDQLKTYANLFNKNEQATWNTLKGHLVMLLSMPDSLQHNGVSALLNPTKREGNFEFTAQEFINELKKESLLFNHKKAEKLFKKSKSKAKKEPKDKLYQLKELLENSLADNRPVFSSHYSLVGAATPAYVKGFMEFSGDSTIYADANFTLRLSGGRITGYKPTDGVYFTPFTTLEGVLAKDSGLEPFDVPTELKNYIAAKKSDGEPISTYLNENGELIVNFLSTNDITGGNSGSPVLNVDGEVVGVAFDGNIEGVFGDYYFDTELKRMISCDIRYILFVTEELYGQKRLTDEMDFVRTEEPSPSK